jgi:DnaJ-class molecular chaperone
MARLTEIYNCWQCEDCLFSETSQLCTKMEDQPVYDQAFGIPDWCPLPEVEEATCEICGGQGWYAADDGSGEPAQVQCEACYGTGKRIAEEATDER